MTKKRTRMAAPATKSRSLVASPPATSVNNANNGSVNVPLAPPAASMALPPPVAVSAPLKKKKKNKKKNKKQQQPQQQQQLQAPPPPPPNSAPVPAANAAVNNAVASSSSSHHHHHHHHHSSHHCDSPHGKDRADDFWQSSSSAEERQKIREFWLQLGEDERRSLVKVEKEAVLRKMKEQQKNSCNCSVCGKKR
ncbi:salt tolerance down-regulator-domain-containing protein [Gongronella butleri]|nr:salt tolerance down-regulator-domain-containing protein [Gongronella butleri]